MLFSILIAASVGALLGDKNAIPTQEPISEEYSSDSGGGLVETDPYYYSNYYNDPAYTQYYQNYDPQFGYLYDSEENQVLEEKQGTGPTPADFIPFFASLSLPLTTALATFIAILVVSAAFLLFPQEIEIDVDSRRKREALSSSPLSRALQSALLSLEGVELARLSDTAEFPTIGSIVKPMVSRLFNDRFRDVDCSSLDCVSKSP